MRRVLIVYQDVALQNARRAAGETASNIITVSVDEKPGVQAIGNTAPDLPPVPGKHPTISRDHEYQRLGTCSILAALDLQDGHVTARVEDRHRSVEFIGLLSDLDARYPPECTIRIILDNHSAHISKETHAFLSRHPNRFQYVLTPKHGSWLNIVETLFGKMARSFLRHIRVQARNFRLKEKASHRPSGCRPPKIVRVPHMLIAAYLTASFLVAGVGAFYLLRRKHTLFARKSVSIGMAFAAILIAGQVFIGDILYGTMLKHQPSKMQAAEGFWEKQSQSPAPYYWVIVPDQAHQRNRVALGIPYLGSIWLTHSLHGRVEGLKSTPRDRQPLMGVVFCGFRIMYGIAILMFGMAVASLWLRWHGGLFTTRWFLRLSLPVPPAAVRCSQR